MGSGFGLGEAGCGCSVVVTTGVLRGEVEAGGGGGEDAGSAGRGFTL